MQIINFKFNEKGNLQGLLDAQNNPWFVAKDVCQLLNISDTSRAVEKLDEDEKLIRPLLVSGQDRKTWTVNESGVYNLIFRTNKPGAKAFRKWVTATVLPEIRKHGVFGKEHIMEKEKAIQDKLTQIDEFKKEVNDYKDKLTSAKKRLDKANNELHEILKTSPNQLKLNLN